jgi:branched-chain amino acid transport system ATP-binding protein
MSSLSLSVEEVSKSFGNNVVLRNIHFRLKAGDVLGIIGPNGAGKTTLLNIISGFVKPDKGRVILNGQEVTGLQPHEMRRLGVVRSFQIPKYAKNLTVLENVLVSTLFHETNISLEEAKTRGMLVLRQLGLEYYAENNPTILPAAGLKKLELARILVSDAKIALFDEITAGLSEDEREYFINAIKNFHNSYKILILVDHVLTTIINLCPRVIVLDKGEIIADGKPADVLNSRRVIESYVGDVKHASTKQFLSRI